MSVLVWAGCSFACGVAPARWPDDAGRARRLDLIERGLDQRETRPADAAKSFLSAGPGAELETLRLRLLVDCLERSGSGVDGWRSALDQGLPPDLEIPARASLAGLLLDSHRPDEAAKVIEGLDELDPIAGDRIRLRWPNGPLRWAAANRLAVAAPGVLRNAAPDLEVQAVAGLSVTDRIRRAASWRLEGHPSRGRQDLRSLNARGDEERARRLELARCENDRGSLRTALGWLPGPSRSLPAENRLRAEIQRRIGWSRFPTSRAGSSFAACQEAASRAAEDPNPNGRREALELVVECATEAGRLSTAVHAWDDLEAVNWSDGRRSWLGRRLGLALVRAGRMNEAERVAAGLEEDSRCLEYWLAGGPRGIDEDTFDRLTSVGFPDLYALWAAEDRGRAINPSVAMAPPLAAGAPPPSVGWLIGIGEGDLAALEWSRVRRMGERPPEEMLAAALFEQNRGRNDLMIRCLRAGFRNLGGVDMARSPGNVVRTYLPLAWSDEVKAAAREFGLRPWLLAGLARQESIFNPNAVSPAGARGLIQLMSGTARGHAAALGLRGQPNLHEPGLNLRLGAREFAHLTRVFGSVEPALAAYNAGESRVRRWWRRWPDAHTMTENIPIPETYWYVRRVRFLAEAYRRVWADAWAEDRDGPGER